MISQHTHYWQKIPQIATILFVFGFIGGIALRSTIFLTPLGQEIVDLMWYIGVGAYTVFYFVRISIENHRREVCETGMIERLKSNALSPEDVAVLHEMLSSHCRSKVKYNYVTWFVISAASLIGAVFLTR